MFRIIKDGASLGLTEKLNYIMQAENGCYVLCPEQNASGIVFEGTPYHLLGRDSLEGLETVSLEETDAGSEMKAVQDAQKDSDALNVDHDYRLVLLELNITTDSQKGGE